MNDDIKQEQQIKSAKTILARKALAFKNFLEKDRYKDNRSGLAGLNTILSTDAELHPLFQRCKFDADLTLAQYMDQQYNLKDYDKKILAVKEEYDVENDIINPERNRSRSRSRGRNKKKKKSKRKAAHNGANSDDDSEFNTSSSDNDNGNIPNPYSSGYDGDTIKLRIQKRNQKRIGRQICPDSTGSDFTVVCLKQFVSDGGVEFETRNARMCEFLKVKEYKADKFTNWKQLDVYNEGIFPFLFKALFHMYENNVGSNNPEEYKLHVDDIKSKLIIAFEKVIGLYIPLKINLTLISLINSSTVTLNNIIDETQKHLIKLTGDSKNLIDAQYTKNGSLEHVCIGNYISGVCTDKDCNKKHQCIFARCNGVDHNISKCYSIKMSPSTRVVVTNNIHYNQRMDNDNTNGTKPYNPKRSFRKRRYRNYNNNNYGDNKPYYQKHNPYNQNRYPVPVLDTNWMNVLQTIAQNTSTNNNNSNNDGSSNGNAVARGRGRGRGN